VYMACLAGRGVWVHPLHFKTGCLPLNYSGSPGVSGVSDREGCVDGATGSSPTPYAVLYLIYPFGAQVNTFFPAEIGLDYLYGVSFQKGCYVGTPPHTPSIAAVYP
jgi:hypothetical protein